MIYKNQEETIFLWKLNIRRFVPTPAFLHPSVPADEIKAGNVDIYTNARICELQKGTELQSILRVMDVCL